MGEDKKTIDIDQVIEICQNVLKDNPKNATAHHDLGVALLEKREVDQAIEHLEKAAELAPKHVLTHYVLGIAQAEKMQLNEAVDSWKRVLELDKRNKNKLNGMTHYFIGKSYGMKGMWDASLMELRRAAKLLPQSSLVKNALGEIHLAKGDLEAAKTEWLAAADLDPQDARAALNVCAVALDTGDYPLAIEYGHKVLSLGQEGANVRFNLGIAYMHSGD